MSDFQGGIRGTLLSDRSDILVAIGVIVVVSMLIIPLPSVILDLFMAANLVLSLLVILIVLYTKRALDFSIFPTILLMSTVFSLALNVSSTRLILSKGAEFDGKIVQAFATFVVGTEGMEGLVIGFIIFIILIAVQFIVITKGATRVAEVAARFTLDALPGKQMAIDAAYNAGSLNEEEATTKRNELQREADFYGAMDGASKFVSGNVKVGILITAINVIGGLIVGVTIHGESFALAANTYVSLTVGDGLVTQFPALLIATSTGLIVTRAISDGTFGHDVSKQFSRYARVYWIATGFLFFISFLPGFPWYVLIPLGAVTGIVAYRLSKREVAERQEIAEAGEREKAREEQPEEVSPVVPLDPLSLELGYGLIPLVDKDQGAELLDRITRIRRESALEMGLVVPRIRIIDNMRLDPNEYSVKIRGVEIGRGVLKSGHYLAINPGDVSEEIEGEKTTDPAFGLPALWISEGQREEAERGGYTVVDSPSIIATHLTEIIKKHAHEMLGRQEVKSMLDTLRENYPAVVDEVLKTLSLGEVEKVLQGLLMERVSIRNIVPILETVADYAPVSKETSFLVEKARQTLGRQICLQYADEERVLHVLTIEPSLEQKIIDSRVDTTQGPIAALEPDEHRAWINAVMNAVAQVQRMGYLPIILCSEAARRPVRQSIERDVPDVGVISVPEVVSDIKTEGLGEINLSEANSRTEAAAVSGE
ncbi:MAG: flagellar biosynthesis protein FlhA [Spirochaetaceae bacterium]